MGNNHWLTVIDKELIELAGDRVVSRIAAPESLRIVCGHKNQVIALTENKIMKWERGALTNLSLPFTGRVSLSDGVVVYATDFSDGLIALYANKGGISTEITKQNSYSGSLYGGYYKWSNPVQKITFILKNGHLVKRWAHPSGADDNQILDYKNCPNDALFVGGGDFFTQSRFGIQKVAVEGVIKGIDYPKGCGDYLFLLDDLSYAKGTLWSLKPGKSLSFKPLSASCFVDYFVANDDGSLFYRCDKRFFYKDKFRTKDVFLGESSQLQVSDHVNDRWLSTPHDGALFMYLPDSSTQQKQSVCFVRVTPQKIVDIGCTR